MNVYLRIRRYLPHPALVGAVVLLTVVWVAVSWQAAVCSGAALSYGVWWALISR